MIIENTYFDLFLEDMNVVMHTKKTGFLLKSFDKITSEYPRLKINSFPVLQKALTKVGDRHVIGTWLPLIDATISTNKMTVELLLNVTNAQLTEQKSGIMQAALSLVKELGVTLGIKELTEDLFVLGRPIIVAEGKKPIRGADAKITYIEQPERKPHIREDGSADYYEMNFVTQIEQGEWLGEKILPQEGMDGMDVFGNVIPSTRGLDAKLEFNRKSVTCESEDGKMVLRALHAGALEFINGVVSVGKHLVIESDVGPKTGSITFDGTVVVYGTVLDDFSITATGDISIEGNEGVTNAKMIQSSGGDVYIKGGVFGGGKTVIEAKEKIYLKHANNCKLYAKEVQVGVYLFGTDIIAENVYVDNKQGKIIGGIIEALYTIECAMVGNNHERMTTLCVTGVDKEEIYIEIKELALDLKRRNGVVERLEEQIAKFEAVAVSYSDEQVNALNKSKDAIITNNSVISQLDKQIQIMLNTIKNAETPRIKVTRQAFPGTVIQVGKLNMVLQEEAKGEFCNIDGELIVEKNGSL
ncbi:DUF342 domain-containing protein [Sporosarcina sp. CAU 1771]